TRGIRHDRSRRTSLRAERLPDLAGSLGILPAIGHGLSLGLLGRRAPIGAISALAVGRQRAAVVLEPDHDLAISRPADLVAFLQGAGFSILLRLIVVGEAELVCGLGIGDGAELVRALARRDAILHADGPLGPATRGVIGLNAGPIVGLAIGGAVRPGLG